MSGRVPSLYASRSGTGLALRFVGLSSILFPTGIVCCLPTCAQGSSAAVAEGVGDGAFWAFWALLGILCIWRRGGAGFASFSPHVYKTQVTGCPRAAAAVTGCVVQEDRWILPHLAVRTHFQYSRWVSRVSQPVQRALLWPASWLPVLDKSRGSKSAEVQRVWGVYDDRLQFMAGDDALNVDEALRDEDVSRACDVWSSAAEAALADAYQFAGGPVPDRGLVLGRGSFLVRRNFADPQEG